MRLEEAFRDPDLVRAACGQRDGVRQRVLDPRERAGGADGEDVGTAVDADSTGSSSTARAIFFKASSRSGAA